MATQTEIDPRLEAARAAVPRDPARRSRGGRPPGYLVGGAVRDAVGGSPAAVELDLDIAVEGELDAVLGRLGIEGAHPRALRHRRPADRGQPGRSRADPARDICAAGRPARRRAGADRRRPRRGATSRSTRSRCRWPGGRRAARPLRRAGRPRGRRPARCCTRARSRRPDAGTARRPLRGAARTRARPGRRCGARRADLATVSDDRVSADLLRIAAEPEAVAAFDLLADWGVSPISRRVPRAARRGRRVRADRTVEPAGRPRPALLAAIAGADPAAAGGASELADLDPARPAPELYERARHHSDIELAIARAKGAEWLDRHVARVAAGRAGDRRRCR